MEIKNVYKELERVTADEKAGIKVDKLTGDDSVSVFVAEIAEQKWVKPHYHQKGVEIYHILDGRGLMKIGQAGRAGPGRLGIGIPGGEGRLFFHSRKNGPSTGEYRGRPFMCHVYLLPDALEHGPILCGRLTLVAP